MAAKGTKPLSLPAAPLAAAVEARLAGRPATEIMDPTTAGSYRSAVRRGRLSDALVDRICVRVLGSHPAVVYGHVWWDAVAGAPELPAETAV